MAEGLLQAIIEIILGIFMFVLIVGAVLAMLKWVAVKAMALGLHLWEEAKITKRGWD